MSHRLAAVVKIGGSLARTPGLRERLRPLPYLQARAPVLAVPGGGPLADAVRATAERHELDDTTLHWMAVLAMDQYGLALGRLLEDARTITDPDGIGPALGAKRLPILMPFRWLRREDPLPHGPAVTSDSIAAWVARRLGAPKLILVKSAPDRAGVDGYFPTASAGLDVEVMVPDAGGWRRID